jgi:hypothetical protein
MQLHAQTKLRAIQFNSLRQFHSISFDPKIEARNSKASGTLKKSVIQMFTMDLTEQLARPNLMAKGAVSKELDDKYEAIQDLKESLKDANEMIDENARQGKHF